MTGNNCSIHDRCIWELSLEGAKSNAETAIHRMEKAELIVNELLKEIEALKSRKCSHGDYRMYGTTDCKNWDQCSGRADLYVIGDGVCFGCQNKFKNLTHRE